MNYQRYNPPAPDARSIELLADVLEKSHRSLDGPNAKRFRATHKTDLDRLDHLIRVDYPLLETDDDQKILRVSLLGLHFVKNDTCNTLVEDIDRVANHLYTHYETYLGERPIKLRDIASAIKINRPRVDLCVHYAIAAALILPQNTATLRKPGASVVPTEKLLQFDGIKNWLAKPENNPYITAPPQPPRKPHGKLETSAQQREVILSAALWMIKHRYKNCLRAGALSGECITVQIELERKSWWYENEKVPAHRTMVDLINKHLNNIRIKK